MQGMVTTLIGVGCFFLMPDTPALSGKWLSPDEQKYLAIQTIVKNNGSEKAEKEDKFKWTYLRDLLLDYKVYLQAWILFACSACAYGRSHLS